MAAQPKMVLNVNRYDGQADAISLREWDEIKAQEGFDDMYTAVRGIDEIYGSKKIVSYNGEEDMFVLIY
jgi:hypothetical protein